MAVLCRDHNLLFIMVPGTGCSVIGGVLRECLGGEWLPEKDLFEGPRLKIAHKHCTVPQLLEHGQLTHAELNDLTVFATVRNPFDRFVTEYQRLVGGWTEQSLAHQEKWRNAKPEHQAYHARRVKRTNRRVALAKALGFDGWLAGKLAKWRFETRWMPRDERHERLMRLTYPLTEGVSTFIRYEALEDDLNRVLTEAGVTSPVQLPHHNKTPGKAPYPSYYSVFSQKLVERILQRELEAFGYVFAASDDAAMQGASQALPIA